MQQKILYLIFLGISYVLTACGQMGPLYLADQKPPVYIPPSSFKERI